MFEDVPTKEYDLSADESDIELQNDEFFEDASTSAELEVLHITNMVHIADAETKTYCYKEIHMGSLIHNCGTLVFDHCTIFYNENDYADEISCDSGAGIRATNCTFVCKGMDEHPFITVSEHCTVTFDRCAFVACFHFISTGEDGAAEATLAISNCEMHNCHKFAKWGYSAGSFELTNTKIDFDTDYAQPESFGCFHLFDVHSPSASVHHILVSSDGVETPELFDMEYGCVTDSEFKGVSGDILSAQGIENCLFENCIGKYRLIGTCDDNGAPYVKSCVFDNCSNAISANQGTAIMRCTFVNCQESLICSGILGGVEISYCQFINYKNSAEDRQQGEEISDPQAGIKLYTGKDCKSSIIQKCSFDGIDINEGFLISSSIVERVGKRQIRVIECDFRNCVTRRNSGKIIKQYSHYYGSFGKVKYAPAITVESCRGLDRIRKNGGGTCQDETVLARTKAAKAKFGVKDALLPIGIGIVGGPIYGIIAFGISSALRKKAEKEKERSDHAKAE